MSTMIKLLTIFLLVGAIEALTLKETEYDVENALVHALKADMRTKQQDDGGKYLDAEEEYDDGGYDDEDGNDEDETEMDEYDDFPRHDARPWFTKRMRRWRFRKFVEHGKKVYHKLRPHFPYFLHGAKILATAVGKKRDEDKHA